MMFQEDDENTTSLQTEPGEEEEELAQAEDQPEEGDDTPAEEPDLFEDLDEYIGDPAEVDTTSEVDAEELSEFQKEEMRYREEMGQDDDDEGLDGSSKPPGGGAATATSLEDVDLGSAPSEAAKQKAWAEKRKKEKRWYIVHTYSGHENKVKVNLERRIESMNMQDKIFRVEVPQKQVTKLKDGKRIEREERLFPGYVLVEMVMEDDSWYVVRHTPGVTKFVGAEKKPIPAKDSEIRRILLRSAPAPTKVQIDLKVGENVRIISGPFADFEGTVTEVSPEKEKLKATVSIFGRETPVELAFNQVVKL